VSQIRWCYRVTPKPATVEECGFRKPVIYFCERNDGVVVFFTVSEQQDDFENMTIWNPPPIFFINSDAEELQMVSYRKCNVDPI